MDSCHGRDGLGALVCGIQCTEGSSCGPIQLTEATVVVFTEDSRRKGLNPSSLKSALWLPGQAADIYGAVRTKCFQNSSRNVVLLRQAAAAFPVALEKALPAHKTAASLADAGGGRCISPRRNARDLSAVCQAWQNSRRFIRPLFTLDPAVIIRQSVSEAKEGPIQPVFECPFIPPWMGRNMKGRMLSAPAGELDVGRGRGVVQTEGWFEEGLFWKVATEVATVNLTPLEKVGRDAEI